MQGGGRGPGSIEPSPLSSLQLVAFGDVLENVTQDAHIGLAQLAERLPALSDEERKRQLLQYLQITRQRLQRLHVCAQWAHKAKAVNTCREVLKAAQDHGAAFVHTADELFRLHEELRFTRAPLFDVSTALHISQTGTYRLLPRVIEDELQQPGQRLERPGELDDAQRAQRRRDALRRVDFLLRSKLLASKLPAGMRVLRVRGGKAEVAAAGGQYTAQLTLVPSPREDVTLAKFRPPGEAEEVAAKVEHEVTQPAADGQPSTSAAAAAAGPSSSAAAAAPAAPGGAGQQREGPDCWRWQLLSFELLPAAAGHDPPPLLPAQRLWLQQHIEQRMWAAGDVEQLVRLGKQAWVTVPEPLSTAKEQQQQQGKASSAAPLASAMPAPSSGPAGSQPATAAAAAADKGKQPMKEEPEEQQGFKQQQQQQQEQPGHQLPQFATRPLVAMHGILCQTAGRLALFSLLLSDARQLESGSWKGSLKLSRGAGGNGLRLSYWQHLPCVSYAELQCLREGRPYQPDAAAAGGPAAAAAQQVAPAVEVVLEDGGSLAASSSPQLRHALSGEEVQLSLPLDSASSLSTDRLLLAAAAHSAALQLAAVQAALQQGGRLAAFRTHAELSLAAASSAAGGAGTSDVLPASPQLHLWCVGSLQLSLSMQLRTGRLLLLAGPALLETEQGSDAAASVAAAQQQLDQGQRDAMNQPLPPGTSRGMLAARLAADTLSRLSMQLSMRRQIDAAAAAAAACGLRRAALPQQLLEQHLRQVALLLAPLSSNTLTLVLPAFPPPHDMQRWARQQQRRRQGSAGSGAGGCGGAAGSGATRCFLLLDFGDPSVLAAAGEVAEIAVAAAAQRQAGPPQASEQALPRMLLAVCGCTARGTVNRVVQLSELPRHVVADAKASAAGTQAGGAATSRKRRASDAATSEVAAGMQLGAVAAAAAAAAAATGSANGRVELELGLARAAAWCRRQASWEALRSQLQMLPVQHAEEMPLGRLQQRVICLPKAPVLVQLEAWAVAKLAAAVGAPPPPAGLAPKPAAWMRLEEDQQEEEEEGANAEGAAAAAGAWRVDLKSAYFGRLAALLQQHSIRLAPPAADAQHITGHSGGLTLRYSLAQGHSVLTAITDLVRLGMLHIALTRMAGCMAANPLAAGSKAACGGNGSLDAEAVAAAAACDGGANGILANGPHDGGAAHAGSGSSSNGSTARLVWPLPGCGSVRLAEAGLTHMLLLVAPPALPEGLKHLEQPAPVRVTVSWDNTLLTSSSSSSSMPSAASTAPVQRSGTNANAAPLAVAGGAEGCTAGSTRAAGSSSTGSLRHIQCRVSSEPPLPEPVAACLAQQLEAGRIDLFLDSLCLAAHQAAGVARQLSDEAQRSAGLLPGALKLQGLQSAAGSASGAAGSTSATSALNLRAQLQQGGRAATLRLAFHAGGYTLFQLAPALSASAAAAASIWMPPLWDRLCKSVPTFAAVDTSAPAAGTASSEQQRAAAQQQQQQQLRQAWVHHSGVAQAVATVMRAVAATVAEAC